MPHTEEHLGKHQKDIFGNDRTMASERTQGPRERARADPKPRPRPEQTKVGLAGVTGAYRLKKKKKVCFPQARNTSRADQPDGFVPNSGRRDRDPAPRGLRLGRHGPLSLLVVDVKFGVIRIRSHQEVSWDPFVIVKAINLVRRQRQSVPDGKIEKGPPGLW